jgi:hypothetical protein
MMKRDIMRDAAERLRWLEDRSSFFSDDSEVGCYALLLRLIAAGDFDDFFADMGCWQPIDGDAAAEGKRLVGLGALSEFEKDCPAALEAEVSRREIKDAARRGHIATVHPLGFRAR